MTSGVSMNLNKPLKAKELRKLTEKELLDVMPELDRTISRFRAAQAMPSGQAMINLPPSVKGDKGGTNWGLFSILKKNKAIILTVLTEQRKASKRSMGRL